MTIEALIDSTENFKTLSQKDKVKRIAYFHCVLKGDNQFTGKALQELFVEGQIAPPSNIHDVIGKLIADKPRDVIRIGGKYSLERDFVKKMDMIYLNAEVAKISKEMSTLLDGIANAKQREFLEDALKCVYAKIYRPSIIMMWLLTMDILYDFVLTKKLSDFNAELKKKNIKYIISSKSDFENIKESVFIETLRAASIISKEQKKILDDKLDIRNSAAHPNQTSFKQAKVISFIEELIEDIVEKFQ